MDTSELQIGHEQFMQQKLLEDQINNPSHYERWKVEPITFIMKNDMPFWMGNIIKYVARAGAKENTSEVTDLKKAKRYIDMRINQLENRNITE